MNVCIALLPMGTFDLFKDCLLSIKHERCSFHLFPRIFWIIDNLLPRIRSWGYPTAQAKTRKRGPHCTGNYSPNFNVFEKRHMLFLFAFSVVPFWSKSIRCFPIHGRMQIHFEAHHWISGDFTSIVKHQDKLQANFLCKNFVNTSNSPAIIARSTALETFEKYLFSEQTINFRGDEFSYFDSTAAMKTMVYCSNQHFIVSAWQPLNIEQRKKRVHQNQIIYNNNEQKKNSRKNMLLQRTVFEMAGSASFARGSNN